MSSLTKAFRAEHVFFSTVPTPQRNPVFDAMYARGVDLHVVYFAQGSAQHGWGDLNLNHPHTVVGDGWFSAMAAVTAFLTSRSVRVVAPFGYRGKVRSSVLLASRLRPGVGVVTRSDSNLSSLASEKGWKLALKRATYRTFFPRRTRVWTIGSENERFWREFVGRTNTLRIPYTTPVLPNSLAMAPKERSSDPDRLRFLYVGRLVSIKSVDTLVRAFLDVVEHPGWTLHLVGEGPERATLERLAAGDPRIRFHGSCEYDELDRHYFAADVLVLPSAHEPWGLVVNEGLGFGLRVIVSDRVAARELLRPDEDVVVPHGDVPALTQALRASAMHLQRQPVPPGDPSHRMQADLETGGR